jgi:Arc/MetJ family transcription regulator
MTTRTNFVFDDELLAQAMQCAGVTTKKTALFFLPIAASRV